MLPSLLLLRKPMCSWFDVSATNGRAAILSTVVSGQAPHTAAPTRERSDCDPDQRRYGGSSASPFSIFNAGNEVQGPTVQGRAQSYCWQACCCGRDCSCQMLRSRQLIGRGGKVNRHGGAWFPARADVCERVREPKGACRLCRAEGPCLRMGVRQAPWAALPRGGLHQTSTAALARS
jgi:hypothetical protein